MSGLRIINEQIDSSSQTSMAVNREKRVVKCGEPQGLLLGPTSLHVCS